MENITGLRNKVIREQNTLKELGLETKIKIKTRPKLLHSFRRSPNLGVFINPHPVVRGLCGPRSDGNRHFT